jgi:hypothetical protein
MARCGRCSSDRGPQPGSHITPKVPKYSGSSSNSARSCPTCPPGDFATARGHRVARPTAGVVTTDGAVPLHAGHRAVSKPHPPDRARPTGSDPPATRKPDLRRRTRGRLFRSTASDQVTQEVDRAHASADLAVQRSRVGCRFVQDGGLWPGYRLDAVTEIHARRRTQ